MEKPWKLLKSDPVAFLLRGDRSTQDPKEKEKRELNLVFIRFSIMMLNATQGIAVLIANSFAGKAYMTFA